jgi:hypothetical protein
LRLIEEQFECISVERIRVLDMIRQAQRDGQYEFAGQCVQLLAQSRTEQVKMAGLLAPAGAEMKQIEEV